MKKHHIFFGFLRFFIKRKYIALVNWIKNFKTAFLRKKNRIKHISNYFFSKDGFSFYVKKFKYNINFLRYKVIHAIKNFVKNSKDIVNTGYLSFTILLYIILSILFFIITYNIWVQSYDTVKIPDFKGIRVLEAVEQIQSLKLIPSIETRYSNLPYGTIISQYPIAGHSMKQNRKVNLVVSKGLESSYLEDFTGLNVFALEKKVFELKSILKREIKIEKLGEEYSDIFDKGLIISQNPAAGTDLNMVNSIQVVVSKGPIPDSFLMPNFVGRSIEDVQKEAEKMGLILNITYQNVDNLDKVGIVISQKPKENETINKGSVIDIVVGQKKI